MAKNSNTRKMRDVSKGDVLYAIKKDAPADGISEKLVEGTGIAPSREMYLELAGGCGWDYIPKSSMSKTYISVYDSFIATSREKLLKVAEKVIRKSLEKTDISIKDAYHTLEIMKKRKDSLLSMIKELDKNHKNP